MTVETEKIIAEIIANELNMDYTHPRLILPTSSNFITIYNQEFKIPNGDGLFACVEYLNSKVISNNNSIEDDSGGIIEVQSSVMRETLMIDIMSRSSASRQRKHEVVLALNSIFCQQQQDKYAFRIFPISENFINASMAEGASMLNRYSITIYVQRMYTKSINHNDSSINYYDKFGTDVWDERHLEEGIPLIHLEFEPES